MNIAVLIPAYNPDKNLMNIVENIIGAGIQNIIIVNDGSDNEYKSIFKRLEKFKECHILNHAVNLGKGRALKTGMNYFCLNFPDAIGLVAADADGQHKAEDILKVAKSLLKNSNALILGSRTFGKGMPIPNLFGNLITRYTFRLLMGKKISDTQTGLRGIPNKYIPIFLRLTGEGYEYEINQLICAKIRNISVIEEKIETIYIKNNKSSHFNPFFDSIKIYFLLLRYAFRRQAL